MTDWRNDALFSFDLAMVLRGLASVKGMVDESVWTETQEAFQHHIGKFVSSDHQLIPCIRRKETSLPDCWSTRPGAFQLKTAGALLSLDHLLDEALREASFNTYTRWRNTFVRHANELHSSLYAVEGLILLGFQGYEDAWNAAADHYAKCLERLTCTRSDVVAQALRAGCFLQGRGLLQRADCDRFLKEIANILVGFIGKDGEVSFSTGDASSFLHQNAWSAMFAYQAFTFYMRSSDIKLDELLLI